MFKINFLFTDLLFKITFVLVLFGTIPTIHACSVYESGECTDLRRNQMIKLLRRQQDAAQSLHCLPSDPNARKEGMNFIFNEDPDCISNNSVLCSLNFTVDSKTGQKIAYYL